MFPWVRRARSGEPGHPLFTSPVQGSGRVDNPERYRVLYASDSPAGAVAEAFGNHAIWTPQLLEGRPDLPGSVRALAILTADATDVLDLDDPGELVTRKLRPSRVVTRDRKTTQEWALRVFGEKTWAGVRWWSFYEPSWGSYGIWDPTAIRVADVMALTPDHPALTGAATALARPWRTRPD